MRAFPGDLNFLFLYSNVSISNSKRYFRFSITGMLATTPDTRTSFPCNSDGRATSKTR
jgi:hypothetical protein